MASRLETAAHLADRPLCKCHGKPMWRDLNGQGYRSWRCAVKKSAANAANYKRHTEARHETSREWYENLSGQAYNLRRLKGRRTDGLERKRERQLRRETEGAD
jgi:hypothetical protein